MIILLSCVAAFIPAIIYLAIIYWFDRYEKEPLWLLTATFFWGAVPSIILALIFNLIFGLPFYALAGEGVGDALVATLVAPPVEETAKGLALLGIFFFLRHEIDSLLDGIIYGAMVGMGFAMVENVFYFVGIFEEGGYEAWSMLVFLRAIVFGLNHSLFASLTGLGLAVARLTTNTGVRIGAPILGWSGAVALHFLHNLAASTQQLLFCFAALIADWGGVWLMLLIIIWALVQERRWIREYLAEEVAWGTLTTSQYEMACSGRKRFFHRTNMLFSQGPVAFWKAGNFYHQCSELAYKKHHFKLHQDKKSEQLIPVFRQKISELSRLI